MGQHLWFSVLALAFFAIATNALRDQIPDQYKAMSPHRIEEATELIKEKCKNKTGNDAAFKRIEAGTEDLMNCFTGFVNTKIVQYEIGIAQETGEYGAIFHKYCQLRHIPINCVRNYSRLAEPCLEPEEIDGQKTLVKMFENLLDFICDKDGEQVSLFVTEKGVECAQEQSSTILECLNNTFPNSAENEKQKILPKFVIGVEECNIMDKLQACVVDGLKKCKKSTPANVVESMFEHVEKDTVCDENNAAYSHLVSSNLIMFAFVFLVTKIFAV